MEVVRETLQNVLVILTMRCDQASRLISHSQERRLNTVERWALSLHLLICNVCRKYKGQLTLMRNLLGRFKDPELYSRADTSSTDKQHSARMRERISKRIHKELDSS